jgi:hypothetical protein
LAKHKYFEELCALAPLGELNASQVRELAAHFTECNECRHAAADYDRMYRQIVPAVNRPEDEFIAARRSDIRSLVLASIAEAQAQPAVVRIKPLSSPSAVPVRDKVQFALWTGLAASLIAGTAFWLGAYWFHEEPRQTVAQAASAPMKPGLALTDGSGHSSAERPDHLASKADGEYESRRWQAALDAESAQNAELVNKLSVAEKERAQAIAAREALVAQLETQAKNLDATQAALHEKEAQLEQSQAADSSSTVTLVALQYQVRELTQKLDNDTANLDRERDLLGHGREIRDIIGARNLHIIDVYDTDADGATRRPFARAFYTEHKSLVYYAYDLPQRRNTDGKYSYVAWGQSNGNRKSVQKIGILFNDDQTQKRWSLDFSDPKVLAGIDSVFITLERTDKEVEQPKGRRMLTAYLGATANHP